MRDGERNGKSNCRENEPVRLVHLVSRKNRQAQYADDQRVVEIDRIRELRDPFERTVVEPFAHFLRVRYGEERGSEQKGNEGEPVRSRRPRIREVVGFADVPKEGENRRYRRDEGQIEPVRVFHPFHFGVDGDSSEGHSEKEVEPEQERIVGGEPYGYRSVPKGKGYLHECEMSQKKRSGRGCETRPSEFLGHFQNRSHDRDHRESTEHVEGDVPERTIDVRREKSRRMRPSEKSESGQNPPKGVIHSSEKYEYREDRRGERDVVRGRDSQETVDERALGVRCRRSFVYGPPIRGRAQHSSEYEKEADGYRPGFDELVEIPAPIGKVFDGALLVEVVGDDAQTSERAQTGESGEIFRHASESMRIFVFSNRFFRFPSIPREYIFLTTENRH